MRGNAGCSWVEGVGGAAACVPVAENAHARLPHDHSRSTQLVVAM